MRFLLLLPALLLAACSDSGSGSNAPVPEKPLDPITGRQAFQYTYPAARGWAPDAAPLRVRSILIEEVKPAPGKAAAWEITYVSMARASAKVYTWCAIEGQGSLHKGVFAGHEQSWSGGGQESPFLATALVTDTPAALKNATAKSPDYLRKSGVKPPVNFLLESTPRFPNPTWRVLWGVSVGAAEHQVFVDASTGAVVGNE
ncbi:MAG TPA: hypothetical protein VN841_14610 [Bryobacteraceae bacterium]|nr:hypothetical protein [Bryobacteraceae bacterium]